MDPKIIRARMPEPSGTPGVYVDLAELIRLQHNARGFSFLPRQPLHSLLAGRHASRMRGRGLDFEELRAYQPGDDIRSIDWKVTARTQVPHTRVFTDERDRPALFVVDQRIAMFYGTRLAMKSVVAAQIAALGAWRVIDVGDRVGGLVFDDRDVVEIRPHRSKSTVLRLLRSIVQKNQALHVRSDEEPRPEMLDEALRRAARLAKHDHLVVIVSDFDGVSDDTQKLVTRMAANNDVVLVLVYDPSAANIPSNARLVVSDGDLQVELDLLDQRLRLRLVEYSSGRLERVLAWQRNPGVPVLPIDTASDPTDQVRRLLGQGPGIRRIQ